ncbi:hypothetical protein E5288_WYG006934 [Bos mutus]|uniref:Uncharacterized protein n=1 Tax=Bos mutus TaxID=72004 RepID=A0A6B0QTL2_9CETA|nr:hypothetical protein [Bos mutus]
MPAPARRTRCLGSSTTSTERDRRMRKREKDVLGPNHALRRDKGAIMDQVRRLLCEKTDLLSQACPPACPVAFPEIFRYCEGCFRPPWKIWAT